MAGEKDIKRKIYVLRDGNEWNPLAKYPRNAMCFCFKTMKKAKHCCLPYVNPYVKADEAVYLRGLVAAAKGKA